MMRIGRFTENVGRTRGRRREVLDAMHQVEQAIARPSRADPEAWAEATAKSISELEGSLGDHIAETEAPDGFFAEITERSPRLIRRIDRLRHEHLTLQRAIAVISHDLAAPRFDAHDVEQVREEALMLLGALTRHRHRGADLIYESFNVDIEASD